MLEKGNHGGDIHAPLTEACPTNTFANRGTILPANLQSTNAGASCKTGLEAPFQPCRVSGGASPHEAEITPPDDPAPRGISRRSFPELLVAGAAPAGFCPRSGFPANRARTACRTTVG